MTSRERVVAALNHMEPDRVPEAGVDILNPVQCSAANMNPQRLKTPVENVLAMFEAVREHGRYPIK